MSVFPILHRSKLKHRVVGKKKKKVTVTHPGGRKSMKKAATGPESTLGRDASPLLWPVINPLSLLAACLTKELVVISLTAHPHT